MARPLLRDLHRRRDLDGKTLYFLIRSGSRSRQHQLFEPDEVPEFEGESVWFEVQPIGRGRNPDDG